MEWLFRRRLTAYHPGITPQWVIIPRFGRVSAAKDRAYFKVKQACLHAGRGLRPSKIDWQVTRLR